MRLTFIDVFLAILLCFLVSYLWGQETDKNTSSLKLIFAGDIMGHDGQIKSATIKENKVYDYSGCFKYIRPVLQQADLAVGNLELTLPGSPPYAGYPTFRSPDTLARELRYAGFDLLVTSNNHSNDARLEGLINTVDALDEAGFYHTGTFRSSEERRAFYPLIVYKKGFKLAFLNYTYGTNNRKNYPPAIVNKIDPDIIEKDMQLARNLKPDVIIVLMHWGKEYMEQENDEQKKLADQLLDWGATLIVGTHPHVVQSVTRFEKDNSTRIVAFSLGNFISGQNKTLTDGGILLEVELRKSLQNGATVVFDHHFIPIWRYVKNAEKQTYMCIPIAPFEQKNHLENIPRYSHSKMMKYAKYIRQHMKAFDCNERKISLQEIE